MATARNLPVPFVGFTLRTSNAVDLHTAKQLAEKASVAHNTLEIITATPAEQENWLYRNGHCVGGVNLAIHPSVGVLPTPSTLPPEQEEKQHAGSIGRVGIVRITRSTLATCCYG